MERRHKLAALAAAALIAAGTGVGIAQGVGGDDSEGAVAGPGADRAAAAAVRVVPGGTVIAVEREAEQGATWEVEVRRPDGSVVEVRLDAGYGVVASDGEREDGDREDGDREDGDREEADGDD